MFLNKNSFSDVIKNTPLISIDLIIYNKQGQILLGKRINEPAKKFWFVPGGRIYKDENLNDAFSRIVKDEIGLTLNKKNANFHGIYEHFYKNNVFNTIFGTHYIVLAYILTINTKLKLNNQHELYTWFNKDELLQRKDVHQYSKNYFIK